MKEARPESGLLRLQWRGAGSLELLLQEHRQRDRRLRRRRVRRVMGQVDADHAPALLAQLGEPVEQLGEVASGCSWNGIRSIRYSTCRVETICFSVTTMSVPCLFCCRSAADPRAPTTPSGCRNRALGSVIAVGLECDRGHAPL